MAEIRVEKKKPVWPWILAAVIIAVLVYFLVIADDETDYVDDDAINTEVTETSGDTIDRYNTAIAEYSSYINDPDMGSDHEYSNEALLHLIAAVKEVADDNNINVDADLAEAQSRAEAITENPDSRTHANNIRNAGEIIVRALKEVQTQKFTGLSEEYAEVETALMKIKPDKEVLNQKEDVQAFFNEAEQLLTSMKLESDERD